MEQNNNDNPLKSPVIQEIIISNRIGAIAVILSQKLDIDNIKALMLSISNFWDKITAIAPMRLLIIIS